MKKGDLIIITQPFPDWEWVDYNTGDVGIVMKVRLYKTFTNVVDVFFFHNEEYHPVPIDFLKKLGS
jgi:hypothetical protein